MKCYLMLHYVFLKSVLTCLLTAICNLIVLDIFPFSGIKFGVAAFLYFSN